MLITKFDLYNAEWLDLVFDRRNKNYGAYELRQHYARNMVKAMGLAFVGVGVIITASFLFKPKPVPLLTVTPIDLSKVNQPFLAPQKKAEQPKPAKLKTNTAQPIAAKPVQTTKKVDMVVVSTDPPEDPPINNKITGAIGTETINAPAGGDNVIKTEGKGPAGTGGPETGTGNDASVHSLDGLDVMPEPVGGNDAWNKFLYKNLVFPGVAQDQGISGRVILSFIIEKDGHLSNITVERSAGYGFDEEAIRVLKKAKPWKPGMQNGQPVRVRYMIPINFQMGGN